MSTPVQSRPSAPRSISPEAAAYLDLLAEQFAGGGIFPAHDDHDGWLQWRGFSDTVSHPLFAAQIPEPERLSRGEVTAGELRIYTLTPTEVTDSADTPLFLDFHGGALISCGGDLAWMMSAAAAVGRGGVTWAPDYRMPPEAPYPAALDDALTAYRAALETRPAGRIVVGGTSAGGNLAAALLLRARDEGLPMPAALVLLTPEVDLTESGDSFQTMTGIDISPTLMPINRLYADGHDLAHPYLSPLFGDLHGFPPTYLAAGTRDFFLSNTVRMHRALLRAGVPAELHVFEAMPHGGFGGFTAEDLDFRDSARRFERAHTSD